MKCCSDDCFDAAMKEQDQARKEADKSMRTAWMRHARYGLRQQDFDAAYLVQGGNCAISAASTESGTQLTGLNACTWTTVMPAATTKV